MCCDRLPAVIGPHASKKTDHDAFFIRIRCLSCFGLLWDALGCFGLLWLLWLGRFGLLWAALGCFGPLGLLRTAFVLGEMTR